MSESIYGPCRDYLPLVMGDLTDKIAAISRKSREETGHPLYEHITCRIKDEYSMREKCVRKGLPVTPESALTLIYDAIGVRIVTRFMDDIYRAAELIRTMPGCSVVLVKDYIRNAKPNGYRSFHMILRMETAWPDLSGKVPGVYYAELQLRTLAMDSWASLEHELKYKREIKDTAMIVSELKRVADELASCDLSMQTIRDLIRQDPGQTTPERNTNAQITAC